MWGDIGQGLPGLTPFLHMLTVHRVHGTDPRVVLGSQVQVLEPLKIYRRRTSCTLTQDMASSPNPTSQQIRSRAGQSSHAYTCTFITTPLWKVE